MIELSKHLTRFILYIISIIRIILIIINLNLKHYFYVFKFDKNKIETN